MATAMVQQVQSIQRDPELLYTNPKHSTYMTPQLTHQTTATGSSSP